jgi:hypothetical protein
VFLLRAKILSGIGEQLGFIDASKHEKKLGLFVESAPTP